MKTLLVKRYLFIGLLGVVCGMCAVEGRALPASKMIFIDNLQVRIGFDLALGGAVTFLSSKDHPGNIINSADLGRQIQMSHYSGPWPFTPGGKQPRKDWAGLGWNPIQTGDCFGNPSRVVEHRNSGKEVYIRCIPMQWPLDNVPGDCVFETWTRLEGPVIHMRYRCTNRRLDKTAYHPCPQELPAVYTISKLSRLVSYVGDSPFTGGRLTQVSNDWRKPWPWTRFIAPERWAALVDDNDWGLGVFKADGGEFHGGIYGDARSEDPKDSSTSYLAPIHVENFDSDIVYEHRTDFMLGKLTDIRQKFNGIARKGPPQWSFRRDRQHWTVRDALDEGFPLRGAWKIKIGSGTPLLESGVVCWRAEAAPVLELEIASGQTGSAQVSWKRLDDDNYDEKKSSVLNLKGDGRFHKYHLDLASSSQYRGLVIGLALEPRGEFRTGDTFAIKSIALLPRAN